MSDTKTVPNAAEILDKDTPVPFTYPEGFNAVVNSLQFLPEEIRAQTLTRLVMGIPSL
jgi:hypothetical protein